jgi:hypothetical protein
MTKVAGTNQKAKGKRQKSKMKNSGRDKGLSSLLIFAFCLLPFAFLIFFL